MRPEPRSWPFRKIALVARERRIGAAGLVNRGRFCRSLRVDAKSCDESQGIRNHVLKRVRHEAHALLCRETAAVQ